MARPSQDLAHAAIRRQLVEALANPDIRRQIDALPAGSTHRIALLASKATQLTPADLAVTLMLAQERLVEAGLLSRATCVVLEPPPRRRHQPGTAEQLSLHDELRRYLHQACLALSPKRVAEEPECPRRRLLLLAAVLEGGILSRRELSAFLTSADSQGLRVMGALRYVNTPGQAGGGETLDNRRVHLSPLLRALLLSQTPDALRELAGNPDRALREVARQMGRPRLTLTQVFDATSAYCEHGLRLPLWLLSWMRHNGIYSSALVEENLLRLNRYMTPEAASAPDQKPLRRNRAARISLSEGRIESTKSDNEEHLMPTDDLEPDPDDTLFRDIGRILRAPGATPRATKPQIAALRAAFDRLADEVPAASMLYDWLLDLHDHFTKASTIRLTFFAVASRLLAYAGELTTETITQEDLSLLREQLLEEGIASSTLNNVAVALNHLIRFLNKTRGEPLAPVPTGIAIAEANARILTPQDLREVLDLIASARCLLPPNYRRPAQSLLLLAFHAGLRRQEALHLDWRLIQGEPADILVRNSVSNRLKTLSSTRNVPAALLDIHHHILPYRLTTRPHGLVIQPELTPKSRPFIPGDPGHVKFGEALVREVHRALQQITGDERITLHTLRHSCATLLLLLLLAQRFDLYALSEDFPFLKDVLTPGAEEMVKLLICPTSYQDDGELAAVREILGHSSETMTVSHYVHALDIFRVAALRPAWLDDKLAIGRAAGASDYLIAQHSLEDLLARQERRSLIGVTEFSCNLAPRYELERDHASHLISQMGAVSVKLRGLEELGQLLKRTGHPVLNMAELERLQARKTFIEPAALAFLSTKSRATGLRSIMPASRCRDEAIGYCHHMLEGEAGLTHDERKYYRQSLADSVCRVLLSETRIASSTIRVPDLVTFGALEMVSRQVLGVSPDHHRYFRWKKTGKSHRQVPIAAEQVLRSLMMNKGSRPALFATLKVPALASLRDSNGQPPRMRNPLTTLTWVMASYYVLYGLQ
jgi:integrase